MAQKEYQRIASGVYWVDQVASTQDVLVAGAADFVHGDVIATGNQTAGRGRLDRSWDTPAGTAAAMSMVLRPHLEPQLFGTLTLVVADALVRWFRELDVNAGVKWPNDVLGPDGKKLCGILAQWLPQTNTVVVGIGTNLKFGDTKAVDTAAALLPRCVLLRCFFTCGSLGGGLLGRRCARRLWCGDGTAGVCEDCTSTSAGCSGRI